MSDPLARYGRISAKLNKWFPEHYARDLGGVHWRAKDVFDKAAKLFAETSTAGADGLAKFKELAGPNVVRLTPHDLDSDQSPRGKLNLVAAVRYFSIAANAHVRPPRVKGEHWIIETVPNSIYGGKLLVIGEHEDGACYALRLFDVLDGKVLAAAAARAAGIPIVSGNETAAIDALLALRAQQRAAIFAPFTPKESREQALARVDVQRAIEEDERTGGTAWLELGTRILEREKSRAEIDAAKLKAIRSRLAKGELPEPVAETPTDPADEIAPPAPPPEVKKSSGDPYLDYLRESKAEFEGIAAESRALSEKIAALEGGAS